MAGESDITAGPLPPKPEVYFIPPPSRQEIEPLSTASGPYAGWKVVIPPKDYSWIKCAGCGGEIGIPSDWKASTVEGPKCGASVQVDRSILYRPPAQVQAPASTPSSPLQPTSSPQRTGSIELGRSADKTMIWGIVCILLGWTIIVPILCLVVYSYTADQARKEQVLIPTRANVGLILALLFGIGQGIALLPYLFK